MINPYIKLDLSNIDVEIQRMIDKLKEDRQSAADGDKQLYSYVSKKLDIAGKAIGMALDKINYKNIDFKLDDSKEGV